MITISLVEFHGPYIATVMCILTEYVYVMMIAIMLSIYPSSDMTSWQTSVWFWEIYVRLRSVYVLRSVSFPQIRVQSLGHTQIHVLAKHCLLKSVSSDVTPRSMSFQKHISSDMCPITSYADRCPPKYMFPQIFVLWRHTQIKVICQKKYPHRTLSSTCWTERKNTVIAINSPIHISDTYSLVSVWYQLISCISYPFMLCVVLFLAIFDRTAVCTILCTRPNIDIWIYSI